MKVLHVIANLAARYGGPPKACIEMARVIASRGHQVEIFTTDQDGLGTMDVPVDHAVENDGVIISYFPSSLRRVWPMSLSMGRRLKYRVKEFDVVHIHSLYLYHGLIAAHYGRTFNVPYIVRPHGSLDPYLFGRHRFRKRIFERLFEHRNLRLAAAIHYTSEDEKYLAEGVLSGIAPGVVVPLGLNVQDYANLPEKDRFRRVYPEIGDRAIVLFLGRVNFKKGLDILVPAFHCLAQWQSNVHLVIAGPDDDGYGAIVRGTIEKYGLGGRVTMTGMLEGELKLAALRDAAVFALPSYTENFGIAVVEAMLCGLPVVVSNKVNIYREIVAARAGLVTECAVKECADALSLVLSDRTMADGMGINGRTLVSKHFSWPIVGEKLEAMYQTAISGHTGDFNSKTTGHLRP
ncbi:MAG: glycosyltransferase [Gammaproteobacteria bacterium]